MQVSTSPLSPDHFPRIVFEDAHLVVLEKPAGLLSQGDLSGEISLVDWLRTHFGRHYVGLIHRLDRNTSGLLVVAKRSKSAERLTRSLQEGTLVREYLAWLIGALEDEKSWEHWVLKDERTNIVRVVASGTVGAKRASLRVAPEGKTAYRGSPLTLARFRLETGRSHQIRVQCAEEGFPLLGDAKYGGASGASIPFPRTALHSAFLSFPHPMTKEEMSFTSGLPPDLQFKK